MVSVSSSVATSDAISMTTPETGVAGSSSSTVTISSGGVRSGVGSGVSGCVSSSGAGSSSTSGRRSRDSSRRSSTSSRRTSGSSKGDDVAAMRHLRSVVESIVTDENIPPSERRKRLAEIEALTTKAERALHFKDKKREDAMDDPLGLLMNPEQTKNNVPQKKRGWLKARSRLIVGQLQEQQTQEMQPMDQKSKKLGFIGGALETLEEVEEARRESESQRRGDDSTNASESRRVTAPIEEHQLLVTIDEEEDGDTQATATDSILDARIANSDDYTASVCSVRSLGTFEKDFINNIIIEQQQEDVSVSTFEEDFKVRQARQPTPTQVSFSDNNARDDESTLDDTILSETTFEQDAKGLLTSRGDGGKNTAKAAAPLPTLVVTHSSHHSGKAIADEAEDNEDDVFTFNSMATYERQQRRHDRRVPVGSAQSTHTVHGRSTRVDGELMSVESNAMSVSTYEKDAAALDALAIKIGRKPSTKAKVVTSGIFARASDRSAGTFKQDMNVRQVQKKTNRAMMGPAESKELSVSMFERGFNDFDAGPRLSSIIDANKIKTGVPSGDDTSGGKSPVTQSQIISPMPVPTMFAPPSPTPTPALGSQPSHTAFENDAAAGDNKNPIWFNNNVAAKPPSDVSMGGFERDVSNNKVASGIVQGVAYTATTEAVTGLSAGAHAANAEAAAMAAAAMPKLSPLVVELSPNAIDKGIRSRDRERSIWGRLLCHYGR